MSKDILSEAKLDVLEVLHRVTLEIKNITDMIKIGVEDMTDMMIETRTRYPSDKITFTIADITKNKPIRFFNIWLNLNGQFDADVILEDSQRNLLSPFI